MRDRIYIWDDDAKRLRPAWGENIPGGQAAAGGIRGEIVVGESGPHSKRNEQRNARRAEERAA